MLKTKALKMISKYRYEAAAFILLCVQACIDTDIFRGMNSGFYGYYLADFSMGRTSRLLIGSFVNLLTDRPSILWINCFAAIVLVLTYLLTAVLIGKVIKSTDKEMRPCVLVFSLFSVSGIFSIYTFAKYFGLLDIYMYLFTVLAVVIVRKKMFRWLIPLLCVGGVLVNYVYTIAYFPLIAAVMLYLVVTSEKKAGISAVFAFSCIFSVLLMFYCAFIGKETATVPFEEMQKIMENKLGKELSYDEIHYYDYYLYGNHRNEEVLGVEMDGMTPVEFIRALIWYLAEIGYNARGMISVVLAVVPVFVFFLAVWFKCIKVSETKPKKFVYLCFMLVQLLTAACCILSTDMTRWAASGVMVQFGLGLFMIYVKDKPFETVMHTLKEKLRGNAVFVGIIYMIYLSTISIFRLTG